MPVPTPGVTIQTQRGESFVVGRVLGAGGMGTVVEAVHQSSGRKFALKFLHDELLCHPTVPKRFAREVELATSLTTAHVARTFGVELTPAGVPFMIMELLSGRDLSTLIKVERKLPIVRATRIVAQACEALEEAHAHGIVHRDVKPENLFISTAADGGDWVKVLDFGISKIVDDADGPGSGNALTRVGTTVGTPEYMSPEQLRGARDLDGTADVYSLGCVLYEALSGRRPYEGASYQELIALVWTRDPTPLSHVAPEIPAALVDLVHRAIARDRRVRVPNVRVFREALLPWTHPRRAEGTVVMEPPPSGVETLMFGSGAAPMFPIPPPGQGPIASSPPASPHVHGAGGPPSSGGDAAARAVVSAGPPSPMGWGPGGLEASAPGTAAMVGAVSIGPGHMSPLASPGPSPMGAQLPMHPATALAQPVPAGVSSHPPSGPASVRPTPVWLVLVLVGSLFCAAVLVVTFVVLPHLRP